MNPLHPQNLHPQNPNPNPKSTSSSLSNTLPPRTLREWLEREPFTLTLSSGFFGFYAHAGVLSALVSEGYFPSQVTGSSAGALVGGIWASGRSIEDLTEALLMLRREDFWDPAIGFGLLRGELFDVRLRELLACTQFDEARYPLQVSAFHCFKLRAQSFKEGELAPAIRASCSFPGLFQPVWIQGVPYLDGGITDRPGWYGLDHSQRIFYHHLASRSRWRGALGLTQAPQRENTFMLQIKDLPRCTPHDLSAGEQAFMKAREVTLYMLDQVLPNH